MIGKTYKQQSTGNEVVYDLQNRQFEIVFSIAWLREVLSKNVQVSFLKIIKDIQSVLSESSKQLSTEMREVMNDKMKMFIKEATYSLLLNTKDVEINKINQVCHVKFALIAKVK